MNTKLLEATDVASGTFSLLLLLTLAATVLLFMGTGWVTRKWKLPLTMAGLVMGVSALHYFQAGQVWQGSGQMPAIYRYILWFVSMPLQVMVMYFFVNTMSPLSTWLFWRLLVASVAMVTARYLGETNLMYPSLGFLIGLACWLYVLGEVFFGRMSEVSAKSSNFSVHRGYFWMRLIVSIGWALYPLTYFIVAFAGGVSDAKLNIVYNLGDVVNTVAFSLTVLSASVRDSGSSR
jgi:bacteriorhodopsin